MYKAITKIKSNINYIKTFELLTYILNSKTKRINKLNNKSIKGILIGFKSSNNSLIYISS